MHARTQAHMHAYTYIPGLTMARVTPLMSYISLVFDPACYPSCCPESQSTLLVSSVQFTRPPCTCLRYPASGTNLPPLHVSHAVSHHGALANCIPGLQTLSLHNLENEILKTVLDLPTPPPQNQSSCSCHQG